ncbi:uncharacterized protein HGUI_02199 [Hanseniaspora guilliermondii]|uniref:Homeobox domain-containing protein n=1 Tax=Hanseniaspora guilliermondii TaxID=56406 RepID=A0A1L0CYM5_9ASCO|nr:uncharacterized protein HGUI_02199 [Hanseniaspora guilliermondii]
MSNTASKHNKPLIKLPPLGSLLQISRDRITEHNELNKYYSTPSSSSFNVPYHSPSMSEHDKSINLGRFDHFLVNEQSRSNNLYMKQSPITPPNVPSDSFAKYQAEEFTNHKDVSFTETPINAADDTFYLKSIQDHNIEKMNVSMNSLSNNKQLKGLGIKYQSDIKSLKKKPIKKTKNGKSIANNKNTFAFITHSSSSYSSRMDPSIDNEQLARQKRRRTDAKIVAILEDCYKNVCCRPNKYEKIELSQKTGLTFGQVQVWFQNRRSRDSKKSKKGTLHTYEA